MLPGTSSNAENLQLIHLQGNMRCVAYSETCIEILKVVRCLNHRGVVRSSQLGIRVDLHPWWHLPTFRIQARCKKSKTTIQLKDLPQGVLKPDNSFTDWKDEESAYPTVVQQARNNMRTFSDCVLLTRVGGFYEVCLNARKANCFIQGADNLLKLYFEHAEKYGPLLNLKVAQKKTTAGPVSMVCQPTFPWPSPVFLNS